MGAEAEYYGRNSGRNFPIRPGMPYFSYISRPDCAPSFGTHFRSFVPFRFWLSSEFLSGLSLPRFRPCSYRRLVPDCLICLERDSPEANAMKTNAQAVCHLFGGAVCVIAVLVLAANGQAQNLFESDYGSGNISYERRIHPKP